MAHASGNATWVDWPLTTTQITATTLENMEATADHLYTSAYGATNRSQLARCRVRYTGGTFPLPAVTDAFCQGGWVAMYDTEAAFTPGSAGVPCKYTIPLANRYWDVYFHNATGTCPTGQYMAIKVTLNGASVANATASASAPGTGGETHLRIVKKGMTLDLGDVLYFSVWSSSTVTCGPIFGDYPEFEIRDTGPR